MVKSKAQSKKQQKRGVDFKVFLSICSFNLEVWDKIQAYCRLSVSLEKAGLAVSKKGLTLKELLQQTSHHNARVCKDALVGVKDIFLKYPVELKLHKLAVIEKLRGRISDDDKLVRETLYQLFKSVIFPGCVEVFSNVLL
nr:testis-expressed sequence 10 protein-like [Ipomoea batatas]GMD36110.1 testis-expressed sequence 10 protein-like [Ipomoea batatas]GMD77940.1 testis-expressed sequence 10 protein-like [Ipomoea batatas]GME20879.1 testis-expressed sequence 10 protein-like [Ipomoea batatas]